MNELKKVITLKDLWDARATLPTPIGLVPTMGFLHEGHLSLVKRARSELASVVVSIFVNPTQFAPTDDLNAYPRDLERDIALLEKAGANLLWMPTPEIMYPPDYQTWVNVDKITKPLEGKKRPGHFRGVTTIVAKLFNAIQPQVAYFGQKDAQQVAVIKQMVRDLNMPIEIIASPIIRERDGLAMSSRNTYLNPAERQAALVLSKSLEAAKSAYQNGERNAQILRVKMEEVINAEPLARLEYISCADYDQLNEIEKIEKKTLLSMAVYIGKTRLIDNEVLG
ncbi:MAG: pantoate--beta-alanine ligase [Anaerolineae bacterium]|jgi:pantoate--beta-alanine ligase|nr:pantoate--beta-alanine ligase [Anaerolineae bacterium]MBT7074218.1 pantoate--beta-alanine ligase [Anaerolineae bacterium]MBT7782194.1 pantoate--beta-alanine ligase [Anaerolineae bacterium]